MASTIVEALFNASKHNSKFVHFLTLTGKEQAISYEDILKNSISYAFHLMEKGVNIADRIVIILSTCPEFIYSFFGVMLAGCTPVPVAPPAMGTSDLEYYINRVKHIFQDSHARFILTDADAIQLYIEADSFFEDEQLFLNIGGIYNDYQKTVPYILPKHNDECYIQYTSGSTGVPKGVVLSHNNVIKNIMGIGTFVNANEQDIVVSWLPVYHDMGLIGGMLFAIFHSNTLVLMPPELFVARPIKWLELISSHRATLSPGNNFAYSYCTSKIKDQDMEGLDLSSWRVAFNGSEPIDFNVITRFKDRFKKVGYKSTSMMTTYGLAEATLGVTFAGLNDEPQFIKCQSKSLSIGSKIELADICENDDAVVLVSVGKPMVGLKVKIFNTNNEEGKSGYVGRIGVAGETIMQGYLENNRYAKELLMDEWLLTGDIGFIYNDDLFVCGREKDMIIVRGKNYSLADIENVLKRVEGLNHNFVAFDYIDKESGMESLGIAVEMKEEASDIREFIKEQILHKMANNYGFVPKIMVFTSPNTIPRTINGKVRRNQCKYVFA